ncbi:MAG: endonuclease/exonuclease/phosphatase family protein [Methylophagaceae bacterium]
MKGILTFLSRVLFTIVLVSLAFYIVGRLEVSSKAISIEQLPSPKQAASFNEDSIVFSSYNIAHGRGAELGLSNWSGTTQEKKARLNKIGLFLKAADVDIVVLNEVDFDANWSGRIDQAHLIAEAGEFPFIARQVSFNLSLPGFSLKFGNAILSRFPIRLAERVPLPALSTMESLGMGNHDAIRTQIELKPSQLIEVWGLHLEVRDKATRIRAAEHVASRLSKTKPVVVLGDLNSQPSTDKSAQSAVEILVNTANLSVFPTIEQAVNTFPSLTPDRPLDWVLYNSQWQLLEGEVPEILFSDHLPVISRLKLLLNSENR